MNAISPPAIPPSNVVVFQASSFARLKDIRPLVASIPFNTPLIIEITFRPDWPVIYRQLVEISKGVHPHVPPGTYISGVFLKDVHTVSVVLRMVPQRQVGAVVTVGVRTVLRFIGNHWGKIVVGTVAAPVALHTITSTIRGVSPLAGLGETVKSIFGDVKWIAFAVVAVVALNAMKERRA
jgi:hypothetical protein